MIWWVQAVCLVFGAAFLMGLWAATQLPRLKYLSHEVVRGRGVLITVDRQQLLPPWLSVRETWFFDQVNAIREGDGRTEWADDTWGSSLGKRFAAINKAIVARHELERIGSERLP